MKLHSTPVQLEESAQPFSPSPLSASNTLLSTPSLIDLKLTIRFGQQEIKIKRVGSVWFGLRRGELKLGIETGKIPLEKMGLTASFETEVEEQRERGRESGATVAVSGGIATKDISKEGSKVKCKVHQVFTRGTEDAPIWVFEARTRLGLEGV